MTPQPLHRRRWIPFGIVAGVLLILLSGSLLSEGMDVHGLSNSVAAKRLAEGYGNFWQPHAEMMSTTLNDTQSYMPLGYWIHSTFMRITGQSVLWDKVYSLLVFLLVCVMIERFWRRLSYPGYTAWLPIALWLTTPIVAWSATNNLLEGWQTFFVLLSACCYLRAIDWTRQSLSETDVIKKSYTCRRALWVCGASVSILLAFLIKGAQGLFPILMPLLAWFTAPQRDRLSNIGKDLLIMLGLPTISLVILSLLSSTAQANLVHYVAHQLLGGMQHVQTVASHFYILYALALQLLISIIVCVLLLLWKGDKKMLFDTLRFRVGKAKQESTTTIANGNFWLCTLIGLAGVVPIMLGLKQQSYYLVPTIPFFAAALAVVVVPVFDNLSLRMTERAQRIGVATAAVLLIIGALLNMRSLNRMSEDSTLIADMKQILPLLEKGEHITASPEVWIDEHVQHYYYRYKNIVFDKSQSHQHLITQYSNPAQLFPSANYTQVKIATQNYHLYVQQQSDDTTAYVNSTK